MTREQIPELGVRATVFVDRETHGPTVASEMGEGLRVLCGPLVEEFDIVSHWTLHVALYALQNPTAKNIEQALRLIGTSGDAEHWTDEDTLLPLPVCRPDGWGS